MKRFLLLVLSFTIALAPIVSAQKPDKAKAAKAARGKAPAAQTARKMVAPRAAASSRRTAISAPRVQRNPKTAAARPQINRSTASVKRPPANAHATTRVRSNPAISKANQASVPAQANANVRNRARGKQNAAFKKQSPQVTAGAQANANARKRNWQNRPSTRISYATALQRYHRNRHDRNWWTNRYNRFALFGGGYYYWDNYYWYPAYGYDSSYGSYSYDGPIYAYNDLEPGQVITDVQTELQSQGYYPHAVDGQMGPLTRAALANYQRDRGLPITSAIDQDTLEALGLA